MEGNKKKTPVMNPYIAPISIVITCSLPGSAGNAKKNIAMPTEMIRAKMKADPKSLPMLALLISSSERPTPFCQGLPNNGPYHKAPNAKNATAATITASQLIAEKSIIIWFS